MTSTNATATNFVVWADELVFLESETHLTEEDIEKIMLEKDLLEKFINHAIRNIRFWMINMQFKTKEEVELQIGTLIALREWIDKTTMNYKEYKADLEKAKETEVDTRSQEQIAWEKKIADIKEIYNI